MNDDSDEDHDNDNNDHRSNDNIDCDGGDDNDGSARTNVNETQVDNQAGCDIEQVRLDPAIEAALYPGGRVDKVYFNSDAENYN